jgi:hypothetical protein
MTIKELIARLDEIRAEGDPEGDDIEADDALLEFIDDIEVTNAFKAISKWYA